MIPRLGWMLEEPHDPDQVPQGKAISSPQGRATSPQRPRAMSPQQGMAMSPQQGRTMSPQQGMAMRPWQGRAMSSRQGRTMPPWTGRAMPPGQHGPVITTRDLVEPLSMDKAVASSPASAGLGHGEQSPALLTHSSDNRWDPCTACLHHALKWNAPCIYWAPLCGQFSEHLSIMLSTMRPVLCFALCCFRKAQ